jgi:hypothetical protein
MWKMIKNLSALADVVGALRSERDACNEATRGLLEATKKTLQDQERLERKEDLLGQIECLISHVLEHKIKNQELMEIWGEAQHDMRVLEAIHDFEVEDGR